MPTDEQDGLAKDLEAAIAARAELGREYEPALVESFVERLDATIAARVEAEVARRAPGPANQTLAFVLGVISLCMGFPSPRLPLTRQGCLGSSSPGPASLASTRRTL